MFEASRLKVKRANQHIADFEARCDAFMQTDFCSLDIARNKKSGKYGLKFRMTQTPPCDLPLILGDAIHNLRAALDIAYVELITLAGKKPTKWTSFRIWENRKALIASLENGILEGEPRIIDMLANNIRAYDGGNGLLCALDALDQCDKHVLLIPVFNVAELWGVHATVEYEGGGIDTLEHLDLSVEHGGKLSVIGSPGPAEAIELHNEGEPSFSVFFGDGTGLEREPIVPTLTQFAQLVDGVICQFESTVSA